jgi:hypothetical protein
MLLTMAFLVKILNTCTACSGQIQKKCHLSIMLLSQIIQGFKFRLKNILEYALENEDVSHLAEYIPQSHIHLNVKHG